MEEFFVASRNTTYVTGIKKPRKTSSNIKTTLRAITVECNEDNYRLLKNGTNSSRKGKKKGQKNRKPNRNKDWSTTSDYSESTSSPINDVTIEDFTTSDFRSTSPNVTFNSTFWSTTSTFANTTTSLFNGTVNNTTYWSTTSPNVTLNSTFYWSSISTFENATTSPLIETSTFNATLNGTVKNSTLPNNKLTLINGTNHTENSPIKGDRYILGKSKEEKRQKLNETQKYNASKDAHNDMFEEDFGSKTFDKKSKESEILKREKRESDAKSSKKRRNGKNGKLKRKGNRKNRVLGVNVSIVFILHYFLIVLLLTFSN